MMEMAELQPYVLLVLVGFLPNETWRMLGLAAARGVNEESELFLLARAIATAVLAGVIAKIVVFPPGALAAVPVAYEPFDIGTPARLGLRGPYFYGANRTWDEGPDGRFLITRMGAPNLPQGSLQVQVVVGLASVLEDRTP